MTGLQADLDELFLRYYRPDGASAPTETHHDPAPSLCSAAWPVRGLTSQLGAELPTLNEFFIHHEDVRRANGCGPRTNSPAKDAALWRNVSRASWFLARRLRSAGLELQWAGTNHILRARRGESTVRIVGLPESCCFISSVVRALHRLRSVALPPLSKPSGTRGSACKVRPRSTSAPFVDAATRRAAQQAEPEGSCLCRCADRRGPGYLRAGTPGPTRWRRRGPGPIAAISGWAVG